MIYKNLSQKLLVEKSKFVWRKQPTRAQIFRYFVTKVGLLKTDCFWSILQFLLNSLFLEPPDFVRVVNRAKLLNNFNSSILAHKLNFYRKFSKKHAI